jgi:DNA-directed RNA polymerase subunit RPC12/RpoP
VARSNEVWTWINVFEPEYKNLDCPQCQLRRIYFDREIGYYCMSCGQEFSTEEIVMLIEKAARTSPPKRKSGKRETRPPMEIKELSPPKAKKPKRARRDVTRQNPSERDP